MATSLFRFKLRSKRDLVVVRQRARQIAGLLGFDSRDQSFIAAAVFEMAWQVCHRIGRGVVRFELQDDRLEIIVGHGGEPLLRLEKRLPDKPPSLALEDLPWAIDQLDGHTTLDVFEEIRQLNRELLRQAGESRWSCQSNKPAA